MKAGAGLFAAYVVTIAVVSLLTGPAGTFGAIVLLAPVFVGSGVILAAQEEKHRHELPVYRPPIDTHSQVVR
jgi:hypothetical protein